MDTEYLIPAVKKVTRLKADCVYVSLSDYLEHQSMPAHSQALLAASPHFRLDITLSVVKQFAPASPVLRE